MANQKLEVSYHLLTQSSSFFNSPKVLAVVIDFLYKCIDEALSSLIIYENIRRFIGKSILEEKNSFLPKDFERKYNFFIKISKELLISKKHIDLVKKIRDLYKQHEKSPVEFVRKDNLVICSNEYKIEKISFKELSDMIIETKKFLFEIYIIIKAHQKPKIFTMSEMPEMESGMHG